jgi:hypothetical protein
MSLTFVSGIHGTNESSSVYSKRIKNTRGGYTRVPEVILPQPMAYQNPNTQKTSAESNSMNVTFTTSPESSDPFERTSAKQQSPVLHSSELRTSAGSPNLQLSRAISASQPQLDHANSLNGVPPFLSSQYNDFGYFDEINYGLDILNQSNDFNATLDQMMNMSFLSDFPAARRSTAFSPLPDEFQSTGGQNSSDPLFRIPTSDDVPVDGIHTGPPPSKHAWKNLVEARWIELVSQVEGSGKV